MTVKKNSLVQVEVAIAYLLRYGVLTCGAIIAFGLALLLYQAAAHPEAPSFLQQAQRDPEAAASHVPRSLPQLKAALFGGEANAVISVGLMLLIALPILRVAATVAVFLVDWDPRYFAITLFVLSVLLTGIFLGKAL